MTTADSDPLTGLPRREAFQTAVAAALRVPDAIVGVVLIDIDEFAGFNGVLGRATGDAALVELARRVVREVGKDALVARFAEDEFAVMLRDTGPAALRELAQLCLGVVRQPMSGRHLLLTASIGTAIAPTNASEGWELLNQAAVAQFVAKSSGRDRVVAAKPLLRSQIERSVCDGIAEGRFGLNYQPIVTLGETPRLAGVEAYLRWHHPTRGLLFPAKFLPLLEDPRLACLIGRTAIEAAAVQARRWIGQRVDFGRITLNLSLHQLREDALVEDIESSFGRAKVALAKLALDLPGDVYMLASDVAVRARLDRLRAAGATFAVDSGPAAGFDLAALQRLPIDCLRLHRTFADGLSPIEFNRITLAARSAGIVLIAEGVETVEQRDALAAAGCDCAQGWGLGRSMPAAKIGPYIDRLTVDPVRKAA